MRTKPIYLHRFSDGAYYIYKLSNYGRVNIDLIKAGVAFHKGNFTNQFKSLIKKYDLDKYKGCSYNTASTFQEFTDRVYLESKQLGMVVTSIPVPSVCYKLMEDSYLRNEKSEEDMFKRKLERFCIRNKELVLDIVNNHEEPKLSDELRNTLEQIRDRLKNKF